MASPSYYTYASPLGPLTIATDGDALTHIAFGAASFEGQCKPSALTNMASTQLLQFLAGKRTSFDLPLNAEGTEFQKSVWREVSAIPYGETRTYAQVAAAVGNEKSTRAVGFANNRNPLPIVVPCHRVIGAGGKPIGYAGGLKIKEFLLELERVHSSQA